MESVLNLARGLIKNRPSDQTVLMRFARALDQQDTEIARQAELLQIATGELAATVEELRAADRDRSRLRAQLENLLTPEEARFLKREGSGHIYHPQCLCEKCFAITGKLNRRIAGRSIHRLYRRVT